MIHLTDYGFDPEFYLHDLSPEEISGLVPARVTSVHRDRYGVLSECAEGFARLKSAAYRNAPDTFFPTVGDFVLLREERGGDGLITGTLPRKSFFARADGFSARGVQAVAANMDFVLIVTSLNRDFNPRRLERYLAQALQSGATPVLVLTKADLCPDPAPYIRQAEAIVPGTPVHAVSAHTGAGMDALQPYFAPRKTVVLLGMSGVGKSSLLNAFAGEDVMRVNATRTVDSAKGRHTTTHRQLLRLPGGALVIDTPGMRELGLWAAGSGVEETFADIEALAQNCRFSDCRHAQEPGCAIRVALQSGDLSPERLESYLALKRQAQATARYAQKRNKARKKPLSDKK